MSAIKLNPPRQGRAPALYDEQLQRQQQEKILLRRKARTEAAPANDLEPHSAPA